ncbi:MAG: 3-hydroxyacyl-CoA dehydrogenase NAD-binding domain-containing protein, partial [Pseudomonadota bacterium]
MKAAIVGAGVIGGGWAARFLLNGWDVAIHDPALQRSESGAMERLNSLLDNARHSLPALYDRPLPPEGTLIHAGSLGEAIDGARWIQESVPERLDIKHATRDAILKDAPDAAIIASSTSGFTPSTLLDGTDRPGRMLVAHPFNPVYLLPLVELVPSPKTEQEAVATATDLLTGIGMKPLVVRREIDAHIADRLLEAVWREALWLVNDGIATTQEIDDAIRYGFGLRWAQMGLFETYRLAGGADGMHHFLKQFGPALQWPWTKLMDVPELTDDLIDTIARQS